MDLIGHGPWTWMDSMDTHGRNSEKLLTLVTSQANDNERKKKHDKVKNALKKSKMEIYDKNHDRLNYGLKKNVTSK